MADDGPLWLVEVEFDSRDEAEDLEMELRDLGFNARYYEGRDKEAPRE